MSTSVLSSQLKNQSVEKEKTSLSEAKLDENLEESDVDTGTGDDETTTTPIVATTPRPTRIRKMPEKYKDYMLRNK